MKSSWRVGQQILFLVKIDLLANRSTHWPVGWPFHQVQPIGQRVDPLAKNPDLFANGSTRWPTPYNWRVGNNISGGLPGATVDGLCKICIKKICFWAINIGNDKERNLATLYYWILEFTDQLWGAKLEPWRSSHDRTWWVGWPVYCTYKEQPVWPIPYSIHPLTGASGQVLACTLGLAWKFVDWGTSRKRQSGT